MAQKKIVVVESQEELLMMECRLLKKHGYQVHAAKSGEEAVDCINRHKPELVLINVNMPGIDSYSLCEKIKGSSGQGLVPVIMTCSASNKLDLGIGEAAGVDGYVIVPFRVSMFIDTIEKALSGEL